MTTQRFDLVLFDLDGTLVDSVPDIAWSLNAALTEVGLSPLPIETVTRFVGDGAAKLIERALPYPDMASQAAALLDRFVANYRSHLCVATRLYPGVSELLDNLARAGIRSAVLTNKPHDLALPLLATLGVADRFAAVIGDGDGFPRKPDATAARSIMARFGAPPERTIVVGDGLPDVGMARAIPCPVLAAAWGYVPVERLRSESPSFIAHSVAEAAQILLPAPTRAR